MTGTLRAVKLWLGGGATVTISIDAVDAADLPKGPALAEQSGIDLPAGVPLSVQTVFATLIPVTKNAQYAVVARVTAGTMSLNVTRTNPYDGGTGLQDCNSGGGWGVANVADVTLAAYFD